MKKREEKRLTKFLFLAYKFVTVSDSPRLVNFTSRLVNSVLKLPNGRVKFLGEFRLQKNCNQFLSVKEWYTLKATIN